PWGVAVDWDAGHHPEQSDAMYFPFVQAAMKVRYPADADPREGVVPLEPFPYEQGWLVGPVDWENTWGPNAAPVGEYEGDASEAVWLPDEYTVAIWRAFQQTDPLPELELSRRDDGQHVLTLPTDRAFRRVTFYDGHRELGRRSEPPYTQPIDMPSDAGVRACYVLAEAADGSKTYSFPALVANGKIIDQHAGDQAAFRADLPVNKIQLPDDERATLRALLDRKRADVPSQWSLAFSDDFSGGLDDAWYEYYHRSAENRGREVEGNPEMEAVDGTMQLTGDPHHAVAMLPWDWPDDVAVEYDAKALSERPCDLSVVLSGNPSGSSFPWRGGMMFQFGGHYNQGTYFLVLEQPDKNWQAADCGARIEPGKWHHVRVERLDGVARAYIDGELVATKKLAPETFDRFYGRRIGLYTFGSTGRFDNVKVYVRRPEDPSAVQPPRPAEAELDALALGLAQQMASKYGEQRAAATRLLKDLGYELAPAFRRVLDKISNEKIRQQIEKRLDATRPPGGG
ncbi:MAG: LamG-like jellyroll fold domain-containing protein, partial [Planctomycetota bacterium]